LQGNVADYGGGLAVVDASSQAAGWAASPEPAANAPHVTGSTGILAGNEANQSGGAMWVGPGGVLSVEGAIHVGDSAASANVAGAPGEAGIVVDGGHLSLAAAPSLGSGNGLVLKGATAPARVLGNLNAAAGQIAFQKVDELQDADDAVVLARAAEGEVFSQGQAALFSVRMPGVEVVPVASGAQLAARYASYPVTYMGLGIAGNAESNPEAVSYVSSDLYLAEPAARDGYSFMGWSLAEDGGLVRMIPTGQTAPLTLWAQWSANTPADEPTSSPTAGPSSSATPTARPSLTPTAGPSTTPTAAMGFAVPVDPGAGQARA
jgi:uncharacterized repeat protein (TIGR02543 family)